MGFHLIHLSLKARRILVTGGIFAGIFGVAAGGTFFALPQASVTEREIGQAPIVEPDAPLTGRERFISNLTNQATGGLSLTANKLLFEFDGKEVDSVQHVNRLDASGLQLNLELSSLSLHGINFSLDAPITYSDAGNRAHSRGIHASMINQWIYLDLYGNDEKTVGAETVPTNEWDFKYKVDVHSYDEEDAYGNAVVDPVTHGVRQYEYGKLDWLLEDIFSILSDGGINVTLEGWLDNLTGSSSETPAPEQSSEPSSGISTDAILASMDEMVETVDGDLPYFIWHLPLGTKTIELGFRADGDYRMTGIDLPAKYDFTTSVENDEVVYNPIENDDTAWTIQDGMRLEVSADVTDMGHWDAAELVPHDLEDYRLLENSRGLFEEVAKYVAHPQFGLDVELDLGYATEGRDGDRTHVKKDAKSDSMRLSLKADADLDGRKFNGIDATLALQKIQQDEAPVGHEINVAYLNDEEGEGHGFLDVNGNLFRAHTTKTYLDEFYSAILEDLFSGSGSTSDTEDRDTLNQVRGILNRIGLSIDEVLDSPFLTDLRNGVYVSAFDFVESFRNEDDKILITINLEPIGLSGKILVSLDATRASGKLLQIEFIDVKLASFSINGTIGTVAFTPLPEVSSFGEEYDTLCHLKGIGEQVKDIVHEEAFEANLDVTVNHLDEESEQVEEDLSLNGELAFAWTEGFKEGKVDLRAKQNLTDKIVPAHRVALDLRDSYQDIAFAYASAESESSLDVIPEDALKAKLSTTSFSGVIDYVMGRFDALDDRFSRLSLALAKQTSGDLLSRLTAGEYSALLEQSGLIVSADIHYGSPNDATRIVLSKDALGLDSDIVVELRYADENEGKLESLDVALSVGGKDIEASLNSIAAKPIKVAEEIDETKIPEFRNFDAIDSFKDIGFVSEIAEYAVGTLTLGTSAEDVNGEKVISGVSHYGIEGDLSVDLGTHNLTLGLFDAYASVEGAETKFYANLEDLPVIRGVNGPDSDTYFRPHEAEGVRSSEIYYYANGIDPKGQALLTRDSSYGKVRNVRDAVRLDGEEFHSNMFAWLGRYSLGILDSVLDGSPSAATSSAKRSTRPGLLGNAPIRIENVFKGIDRVTEGTKNTYSIRLDLGKLLGIGMLGEASVSLVGDTVSSGDSSFKTLTALGIHADASAKAVNGTNALRLARVDVNLRLNNLQGGIMHEVFGDNPKTLAYATNFVGQVPDSGIVDSVAGLLYDFEHEAWNNLEGRQTDMFGYNFTREGAVISSRNLYR